jgi:hypothetical protein
MKLITSVSSQEAFLRSLCAHMMQHNCHVSSQHVQNIYNDFFCATKFYLCVGKRNNPKLPLLPHPFPPKKKEEKNTHTHTQNMYTHTHARWTVTFSCPHKPHVILLSQNK